MIYSTLTLMPSMGKLNKKIKAERELSDAQKKVKKEQEEKVLKLREFVKKQFWPFLTYQDWSVEDASIFIQMILSGIEEDFQRKMRNAKVSELTVKEHLNKESKDYERYIKVFDMFADMTIADTKIVVEGMNQAINHSIRKEQSKRKLTDLKDIESDFR